MRIFLFNSCAANHLPFTDRAVALSRQSYVVSNPVCLLHHRVGVRLDWLESFLFHPSVLSSRYYNILRSFLVSHITFLYTNTINMKIVSAVATSLLMASTVSAFMPASQPRAFVRPLQMSDEQPGALVPIKEETVEFTAGLIGGAAGFVVGGPVLSAIGAAAANYVSKMDGDVSTVVQAVSKSSIEVFNYLANLDKKYEVVSKAQTSLTAALDKLKAGDNVDPATVAKVESALASTQSKISEINDEYDLVGGAVTAFGVVGDLVEKAIKKAGELNAEYKLTDKASVALTGAVDKAKDAAGKANTSA